MAQDLTSYFEEQSPLGYSKTLTYFAHILGVMWETLEHDLGPKEKLKHLRSLVAPGAVFKDQSASEGGSEFKLGWLLTGLEEPNWSLIHSRANHRHSAGVLSRLADPRGVAVNQAYMKELKMVEDRVAAGHRRSQQEQKEKQERDKKAAEQRKVEAARRKAEGKGKATEE